MRLAPVLAIPPFPGAQCPRFAVPGSADLDIDDPKALLVALAHHRVGGCYWGAHSSLPERITVLDGTPRPLPEAIAWSDGRDPWLFLERTQSARLLENDPRALLVLAAGVQLTLVTPDGGERPADASDTARLVADHLTKWRWQNPFDGSSMTPFDAIALCGFWRELIDANRAIQSVLGIAYWKKPTVTPLLWSGRKVPYGRALDDLPEHAAIAVWRARLTAAQASSIGNRPDLRVVEIEDGFIRSAGLGADCVPPLSIIVDETGPHFVPGVSSGIERLLEQGDFSPELLLRARALREAIVAGGLSKYETGAVEKLTRWGGSRWHVLVPGQVEDDRAVTSGGALSSNLELLRRARAKAGSDAYLIYKPHPDVLAGHRRGLIIDSVMLALADRVETSAPMPALIAMVDELHVNSSLAGFEALMRGKKVTVHGVPFYAGWGLTTDLGSVPVRRTRRRTLDELVAAALLLYPRYLDPVTGLPCPANVLVDRLSAGVPALGAGANAVVALRRATGRVRRLIARKGIGP